MRTLANLFTVLSLSLILCLSSCSNAEPVNISEEEVHTAADIAKTFNKKSTIKEAAVTFYDNEEVFYGWYSLINFGLDEDDSLENLKDAAYTLAAFLPTSLKLSDEQYYEATLEKPAQYTMVYETEDFTVLTEIYSFLENGDRCAEIYIRDAE